MKIRYFHAGLLAAIVVFSVYASIQNLIATKALGSIRDDPVADWEQRFAPIKQRLPFERGVIGYISDSSVPGVAYDAANDEGEYVLAQYALAPIVIVKGTDQEWNIANLDRKAFEVWSAAQGRKFEVIPFKGGLYLLHRMGN